MSAPLVKGWCPGALRPMLSGDGLLVRLRPRLGRLTQIQAAGVAMLARKYGNGLIDLSSRANLQLRGVREADHSALINGLDALGLVDEDAALEARRNLVIAPFWKADDATVRLGTALEAVLAAPDAPELPGKFGFALDLGPKPVLGDISADIRLERGMDGQIICRAEGTQTGKPVSEAEAIPTLLLLAQWFLASGGARDQRGRMAAHLAAGAVLPPGFQDVPRQSIYAPMPGPGCVETGVLVGLAFGQMHSETLAALAALGPLRMTPWRMLLIESVVSMPDLPEIITREDDPLLRVIACTGAPGCAQAYQPTRHLARMLAPFIPEAGLLHVSGCVKGCAYPRSAPLTLVGTDQGFDLIRGGVASASPAATGLPADAAKLAGFL